MFYDTPHPCSAGAGGIHSSLVRPGQHPSNRSIWLYDGHRRQSHCNPADLPVELPTKFDLAINLRTARALDLDLPPLIARARRGGTERTYPSSGQRRDSSRIAVRHSESVIYFTFDAPKFMVSSQADSGVAICSGQISAK